MVNKLLTPGGLLAPNAGKPPKPVYEDLHYSRHFLPGGAKFAQKGKGDRSAEDRSPLEKDNRKTRLGAILLNPRRPKAGKPVLVDRLLPGQKFFDGKGVAFAGVLQRQEATTNGSYHLGLAADHPTLGALGW